MGMSTHTGFRSGSVAKHPPAGAGGAGDLGLTPGSEELLQEGMVAHSSTPAGKVPRTEEPGGLHCRGRRVGRH